MAIRSMTGFGRSELELDGCSWVAEFRCVNNRFLDVKIKLPRGCFAFEERVRKLISTFFQRGRIDLLVNQIGEPAGVEQVRVNMPLAHAYTEALLQLQKDLSLAEKPSLGLLCSFPDVLSREQSSSDPEEFWPQLEQMLRQALENCDHMRLVEGAALAADLQQRLTTFTAVVDGIALTFPVLSMQRQQLLQERLEKLLNGVQLDPARLAQEVALLADKTDVTEEIVRLRSHLCQFSGILQQGTAVGRKLDFLVQEMLREVNTIASKISDAAIAHQTVELKSELEKIREQIQNIE